MRSQPPGSKECLRYAVAKLFDCELESVPHFIEMPGSWINNLRLWAWEQGYRVVISSYGRHVSRAFDGGIVEQFPQEPFIAIIAPLSHSAHAVVMQGDKVIYDSNTFPRTRYQKQGIGIIEFRER